MKAIDVRSISGWSEAKIGNLCHLRNRRAFKKSEWKDQGTPIVRIQNLKDHSASFNYYEGHLEENHRLRGGELLFAWSGTTGTSFGAHIWRERDGALNQHIFRVDFDDEKICKKYFFYAINHQLSSLVKEAQGGVGLAHITKSKFQETDLPIPPFNEQRRIADKLDTTLQTKTQQRRRDHPALPPIGSGGCCFW